MKNKTTTYKWAYLPFVFSSAAIVATTATAGPSGSQRYQDAKQVSSINHEYVGGNNSIGFGVDDDGNVDVNADFGVSTSDNHRTGVGLWAGYDLEGDDKGILGRGGQVNHAWTSKDSSGRVTHVNKTFAAYDRSEAGHEKATVGYGQEKEHLFWDGRVSKGLSGNKNTYNGVSDRAYEWGVGATVGKFLPSANTRIRAGIDHEWSGKVGAGEKNARNTTLSAGIEKFFHGTGHSISADIAGSKNSGGHRYDGQDDTDVTGRLGYKFDFGGSSIYQPDRRYRRVRVEVPGQAVAPRYAQKQQYKKVPTYKTVPVYGNKTVRTPTKQLVKSTMELEGQTFFKLNSSKLIPSAQTRLKQIAAQIRKTGYKGSIRITGNTCGLGDARYDQILSEKRAKEVRNFLIKNGFNPNHLIARGLGKGHPKYPRTPDQDFKNRRVDIEYVSQQQTIKTGYKTENRRVQTGTRRVATGFKNVPAGMKNVMISNGKPGAPRVIWKTEAIPTSPAWIKRALNNNIQHNTSVNTYSTTYGNGDTTTNSGPVANNDSSKTECGQPVTINVLGNDTDADNDALTITSFTQPANGVVTRGANGQLVYTPNDGSCGIDDSFTYTISDGNGGTSTATVNVSVDAPVKNPEVQNDSATTPLNTPVTVDVLNNDTSNSGSGQLTITSVGTPSNGTATLVNGEIVYTPNNGWSGTDSFTYTVTDSNGATATATATVTVEDGIKPVAQNDSATTPQGTAVTLDVTANDTTNSGSGVKTITAFGQPADTTDGVVTLVGNKLVFTPSANFVGTTSFNYTITDSNGLTATAIATVTVTSTVVQPPAIVAPVAANDSATTPQGDAVTLDVTANDTTNSGSGVKTITAFDQPADTTDGVVTLVGNKLVFTPSVNFVGTTSFNYTITDSNGLTATATATVTVEGDKPVAQDDSATTSQGTAVTLDVTDNDTTNSGSGVKTITAFGQPADTTDGVVTLVGNKLVFTPSDNFVGTTSFSYTITDSNGQTATATATVTVEADKPEAKNDAVSTSCSDITINVLDNDDGDNLSIVSVDADSLMYGTVMQSGNQITYKPSNTCGKGNIGTDTFSYTISDGNGNQDSATVSVNVKGLKDSETTLNPQMDTEVISSGETVTLHVLRNDAGEGLKVIGVAYAANGTTSFTDTSVTYTATGKGTYTETFGYDVMDANGHLSYATIIVDVVGGCVTGTKCN